MTTPDAIVEIDTQIAAWEHELTDAIVKQDHVLVSKIRFGVGILANLKSSWLERLVAA